MITFTDFLKANGFPTDVTEIGAQQIRDFILHLKQVKAYKHHPFTRPQDKGLSGHAVNCYLMTVRAFYSWLIREEIVLSNPFVKVRIPKPSIKVIPTFSESQIQALVGVITTSTPVGYRDWTMILTLLDTGLRANELVSLRLEDGVVKVCGKGGKERAVPIGARVQRAMWKYL